MQEYITPWTSQIPPWGLNIVIALAIFVFGKIIAKILTKTLKAALVKSNMDEMLVKFMGSLVYGLLLASIVLAALGQLGIPVTSFMAILGAAGLAIGLALKDSLSNFAAGVMILIFRPFKLGDLIEAGGSKGVVDEIGMFCTLLHTGDNQRIIMPNSSVIGSTITNVNALGTRRIDLVIGISYDDNIGQARDIIMGLIKADSRILADPAPGVALSELGGSSVDINVRPWVNADDYWGVRSELQENIKVELEAAGLSFPFPQQDVHMHNPA